MSDSGDWKFLAGKSTFFENYFLDKLFSFSSIISPNSVDFFIEKSEISWEIILRSLTSWFYCAFSGRWSYCNSLSRGFFL
jgi:hypothetical protein